MWIVQEYVGIEFGQFVVLVYGIVVDFVLEYGVVFGFDVQGDEDWQQVYWKIGLGGGFYFGEDVVGEGFDYFQWFVLVCV